MNRKADIMREHLLTIIILVAFVIVMILISVMFNDEFRARLLSIFDFF